jgi:hypothetical protein
MTGARETAITTKAIPLTAHTRPFKRLLEPVLLMLLILPLYTDMPATNVAQAEFRMSA